MRDDDGLVWRARAERPEDLPARYRGKAAAAALASLRPVRIEVRAEVDGGGAASRTLTRVLVGEGVRIRRWRDLGATLHLPAGEPRATVLLRGAAPVAAALLASRGVLVLAAPGDADGARERLAAVPGAGEPVALDELPVPAGVPGGDAAAWDAVLAAVGARGRDEPPGYRGPRP
jgi:hypothetical protein